MKRIGLWTLWLCQHMTALIERLEAWAVERIITVEKA